jgi:Protein of unknown function (DUF3309)
MDSVLRVNRGTNLSLSSYRGVRTKKKERHPSMRLILLILVILLLLGSLPTWPYSAGWGYYPAGGLGAVLIILIILALVGVL